MSGEQEYRKGNCVVAAKREGRTVNVLLGIAVAMLALSPVVRGQCTFYVDDDNCPGPGSGTDSDPYCTIEDAIGAASNTNTVCVRPGSYDGGVDSVVSFGNKQITLKSTDGPGTLASPLTTITDTVRINNGQGSETVLEGFTIDTVSGTGVLCDRTSPLIRDCIVTGNNASGITLQDSGAVITDTVIEGNSSASAQSGGGVRIEQPTGVNTTVKLVGCLIENNTATFSGGGVWAFNGGTLQMVNCLVRGNIAGTDGGGVYAQGVPFSEGSGAAGTSPCDSVSNVRHVDMQNCLVTCNEADDGGGLYFAPDAIVDVVNVTVSGNEGFDTGGGVVGWSSCVEMHNSILWDDTAPSGSGPEVFLRTNADFTITYSILEAGCDGIDTSGGDIVIDCVDDDDVPPGTVKDDDPLFVDPDGTPCTADDDFHLDCDSPAIDAANNTRVLDDLLTWTATRTPPRPRPSTWTSTTASWTIHS